VIVTLKLTKIQFRVPAPKGGGWGREIGPGGERSEPQ